MANMLSATTSTASPPGARPPSSSSASVPQPTSPVATTWLSSPTATTNTTTTTNTSSSINGESQQQTQATSSTMPPTAAAAATPLHQTLPSAETQRHVAEARAAVVASMGNMVDSELQGRAAILHANAGALAKQERDVLAATDGLRKQREKLAREADAAARRLKEVGNVQNWAEVLERGFLILEETVRLANGGRSDGGDDDDDDDRSCSSCSCSECGSRTGDEGDEVQGVDRVEHPDGAAGDGGGDGDGGKGHDKVNGGIKEVDMEDVDMMMTGSDGTAGIWSDASGSMTEPESGNGTGMAKGSETASTSTAS